MQELESAVGDSNDDVKMIKYKLSFEERAADFAKAVRAELLILVSARKRDRTVNDGAESERCCH